MRLVDDDGVEKIRAEFAQPLCLLEGLHRPDSHVEPLPDAGLLRLFHGAPEAGGLFDLVSRLIQQLPSVREDQYVLSLPDHVLRDLREYNGFSRTGRKDQERPAGAGEPLILNSPPGLLLVRSQFHPAHIRTYPA